jgi:hypothetical protein
MKNNLFALVTTLSFTLTAAATPAAFAMGKKKPSPGNSCNADDGTLSTPNPLRKTEMRPVTTKAFALPNGKTVDLSADLDLMLATATVGTNVFSPTDPSDGAADPCATHLEIRAGVSSLVLNAFELGISFGYSPTGDTGTVTGVTGKTNVRVGKIAMDFHVYECTRGSCSSVAASTASAATAGVELTFEIDFSSVTVGPDLVYNTPLGKILRGIMDDGMKKLAKSNDMSKVSWKARVREFIPASGTLIFDAGHQSGILPNQTFMVYAATPATSACEVFKPMAHIHTTQIEPVSSSAVVDQMLDSRGIQDGDIVMIRPVSVGTGAGSGSGTTPGSSTGPNTGTGPNSDNR